MDYTQGISPPQWSETIRISRVLSTYPHTQRRQSKTLYGSGVLDFTQWCTMANVAQRIG